MIFELPEVAKKSISSFMEMALGDKTFQCPYFINSKRKRDLRAMVGKGTADEIKIEAKIWEKLKGVDFNKMSPEEIKEFLASRGLGIDCSGFALHVLDAWYLSEKGKHIWSELKTYDTSFIGKLRYKLRPVENLGANTITGDINSKSIEINEVRPGDVIRSKWKKVGTHHIQLVSRVEKEGENVTLIEYTHATPYYGKDSGVKTGQIKIIDPKKSLYDQEWLEKDEHGVNFSYEGFMHELEDNGLRRVNAMKDLLSNLS